MSNVAKFLLPAAALIGVAVVAGGASAKKKNKGSKFHEPGPDDDPRPEHDRMLFDDGCNDLIVRVKAPDYDLRITEAYWQMRGNGIDDPQTLTAKILEMDSPQCVWPPGPDSSLRSQWVWDLIYPAVQNYWSHEKAGTLDEQAPVFGTASGWIE